MLREHSVFRVKLSYFRAIRESDGGGGSEFIGYESSRFFENKIIVAPSEEYAQLWAELKIRFYGKDTKVEAIEKVGELDAFIESHTY